MLAGVCRLGHHDCSYCRLQTWSLSSLCAGNAGRQMGLNAASPLVQYSEDASVYQPRSRFAAEAALPADAPVLDISANVPGLDTAANAPILNTGLHVPVRAAAGQEDVLMEVDGQLRHEKGVSAPAIMTAHSWPELVREVQQLAGPVGGMVPPQTCPYQESLWLANMCRSMLHLLSAILPF